VLTDLGRRYDTVLPGLADGLVLMHTEQPDVPRMNSRPSAPFSQAATGVAAALNVECCANGMKRVGFGDLCLTFATPYL
jgi:hypothetical protein